MQASLKAYSTTANVTVESALHDFPRIAPLLGTQAARTKRERPVCNIRQFWFALGIARIAMHMVYVRMWPICAPTLMSAPACFGFAAINKVFPNVSNCTKSQQ